MSKCLSIITSAYKCEPYLEGYFQNMTALVNFNEVELFVVLNEPTDGELALAERYRRQYPENIRIIPVARESIGASTNRGYRLAQTEFLTYADVDDRRAPECYVRQLQILCDHPGVDFTYGDFIVVPQPGRMEGPLISLREFDREEFTRSSVVGPNHFFRRVLLDKCGFWDEQLRSGGDFDFQVRAALNGTFKKVAGTPLLYYTRLPEGGSASASRLQTTERTVIELRYGMYDKIDYAYLAEAMRYSIPYLWWEGQWRPVSQYVPDYGRFLKERAALVPAGLERHRRRQKQLAARTALKDGLDRVGLLKMAKPVKRMLGVEPQASLYESLKRRAAHYWQLTCKHRPE